MPVFGGTAPPPPPTEWTAWAVFRAVSATRACTLTINWYQSTGAPSSTPSSSSGAVTDSATADTTISFTASVPSDAAYAALVPSVASCAGPISAPTAPTVTPAGTAGTTAYYYKIVAVNVYGTVAGAEGSTTTGNATLSSTDYNALSWTAVTGATSYEVWRGTASDGEDVLVASGITTTTYNDEGGGTSGTIPTTNTTGEAHLVDDCGIFPGTVTQWTAGGFYGAGTIAITRSDGLLVRNASTANPLSLPAPNESAYVNDYEIVPGVAYTYTGIVSVVTGGATIVSRMSAYTPPVTLTSTEWWEFDPTNPSGATHAQPVHWQPVNMEQASAHQVLSQSTMNVVANVVLGQDFEGTFEIFHPAVYTAFQALLVSQQILFISSPWGTTDSGYFRVGPMPGGLSMGMGTQAKQTQLLPSTPSGPHRTVAVTAVAALRPLV